MLLTERILSDAGGWQVLKQAKGLHGLGRVREVVWEEPFLRGLVKEGQTEYRTGLKVLSASNLENLCTCRDARLRGLICAHAVAVGLEYLRPSAAVVAAGKEGPGMLSKEATAVVAPKAVSKGAETGSMPWGFTEGEGEEKGRWVELWVVFPPNLAVMAGKGTVSLGVECVWEGRRMLLSALPPRGAYRCGPADMRLLRCLVGLSGGAGVGGALPGMLVLPLESVLAVVESVAGHPRVVLGKQGALEVGGEPLRPVLFAEKRSNGDLALRCEVPAGGALLRGKRSAWMLRDQQLRPVCPGLPPVYLELLRGEVVIPAGGVAGFLKAEWDLLARSFACERVSLSEWSEGSEVGGGGGGPKGGLRSGDRVEEQASFELSLEGSLQFLAAKLTVRYGEFATTLTSRPPGRRPRDGAAEQAALGRLERCGFGGPDAEGQWVLRGELPILEFFARHLPALQREWRVEIGTRFAHVTRGVERIEPKLEVVGSGEDWFELDVALATAGGERFSGVEIQRLIQSGRSHLKRKDGTVAVFDSALLDEFQQVLRDCEPEQRQAGRYRIGKRQAGFLGGFAEESGTALEAPPHWRQWASASRKAEALRPIPLGALEEQLRAYQKHGVYWMHFLSENGLGGILADEMGLGKTVQALAFLRSVKGRSLVVAPSSLLTNWEREAERFLPGIRVVVLAGARRHERRVNELAAADLVITSYPLLRRDRDWYRGEKFAVVILDEAQHIKNPESQNAQAAFALRADRRFVLTGTPLENSVRDVWSLMHFVMPGYLGTRADFRERYEGPVMAEPGGVEHRRMVRRLAPFVLRRTKKAVAAELPDKIEQVVWCDLSAAQREAYSKLVELTRREVSKAEGLKNQGQARILMLTALLRLRQACNDLRLLGGEFEQGAEGQEEASESEAGGMGRSGKLEALAELCSEAEEGGHCILLFSQFSSMLDLLEDWLKGRGTDYCRLDGSTRDRTAQVDRFQTGQVPVFLISLKAGGVGLNLTAADTVIHFDPWWNPAVEAQATDRAHRIGQKSVVTSYKLIMRGTVEEKILSLQNKKRALMDALVESEQPMMEGLSMEDLGELLQG
jgi:superfamily II DNA or RNA helicase